MNTNTVVEAAATIRTALKAAGIKGVSVKSERFSGGSAIDVVIKSADVDVAAVTRIAEAQQRLHRDHDGNITSGGNRYVAVTVEIPA